MADTQPRTADDIIAEAMSKSAASGEPAASGARSRRRERSAGSPEADGKRLTPTFARLREDILGVYTAAQMAAYMIDSDAADAIALQKANAADAWVELAERDPKVKAFLVKLTTGSAWGNVIMAHVMMALPILAKRGVIPGGALFGGSVFGAADAATDSARSATPEEAAAFSDMVDSFAQQGYVPANGVA